MIMLSIGDFVVDKSCAYHVIDMISGIRNDGKNVSYKMKASGLYVSSDKVERVFKYND